MRRLVVGQRNVSQPLRRQFYEAIRTHSQLVRLRERGRRRNDEASQEKSLFKDFWAFSKSAVAGGVGKEKSTPSFSKEVADEWFSQRYSTHVPIDRDAVSWFPTLQVPTTPFNAAPVRPKDVKEILQRKKATSAPGMDGILNGHLKRLDSTHHFLATLFSKTLLSSPEPWEGWGSSTISLIHKAGETFDPVNFRPIALTSVVGKLLHQVLANRNSNSHFK